MNDQNTKDEINLIYARMHIFNAIARRVSKGELDIDEAMLWRGALTRLIEDATSGGISFYGAISREDVMCVMTSLGSREDGACEKT